MSDSVRMNRLLLYARTRVLPGRPATELVEPLRDIGLISQLHDDQSNDYLVGEGFVSLVSFLGCSPDIALTPDEGTRYCYVCLHDSTSAPTLYRGVNTRPPHCRSCRQARQDWQACEQADYCRSCSIDDRLVNLQWRRLGALSSWVIEIMNVYPHEAVPSSQLLTFLGTVTGHEWGYAYLQAEQ